MSLSEQIRLANREKAREYGNRASELNKSGISRQTASPSKAGTVHNENQQSPDKVYSPVQPEILSACDMSVSIPQSIADNPIESSINRSKSRSANRSKTGHHSESI